MSVTWDYTALAEFYDKRADYSSVAIQKLISIMNLEPTDLIADIGAGTGKLTVPLLKSGFKVIAVEPNDSMRSFGIKNTVDRNVTWKNGTGEDTGLQAGSVSAFLMGSSFNVVNQGECLKEAHRTLNDKGWFGCMWNHRDLDDDHQSHIEQLIKNRIPDYAYGKRREDPTDVLLSSGLFKGLKKIEERFIEKMKIEDVVRAWKSHATLQKQSGDSFNQIIQDIESYLAGAKTLDVPYYTRIWAARKKVNV